MITYNNTDITNIKYDASYSFSNKVKHFDEIPEVNPIPINSIIFKTITGIGATHSEIVADRNSIIVLPHISIVTSKQKDYKAKGRNLLAVHGKIKHEEIADYLLNGPDNAKILTTPKGLDKVIRVMQLFGTEFDYRKLFFILLDECHKLIQDAEYRKDMIEVMDRFFEFENKAMISATPIPPSDIRFKEKGFTNIRVCPDYDYKQDVELIHADSLINGLERYFQDNKAEHYFVFFNSVEGINCIVKHFDFKDYMIYCSRESSDLLQLKNERNTSFEVGGFKRFNFLTSSFFNGLDIILDYKPNVVILTDYGFRGHTILDPYTDILQIIGRFRKHDENIPYNKVTHINNAMHFTNPISNDEAKHNIQLSKNAYELVETLKHSTGKNELNPLFDDALTTLKPFAKLLNKDGGLCSFLYDNYLDDERVKNYYQSPVALFNACNNTNLYRVDNKRDTYEKTELIRLQAKSIRYNKEVNQLMANALLELEAYGDLYEYHLQRSVIAKLSYLIFEAYERLSYAVIEHLKFSKRMIERALLKLNIEEGKNSFPVINLIYSEFRLNTKYTWSAVKAKLQEVFDKFGLNYTAKSTDVERYFSYRETKKRDDRAYVFLDYKLYPVTEQKHI